VSYHLNFAVVWRYFGRLGWGLALSLELAAIGIATGVVIGLALALFAQGRGRVIRTLIATYVEFFRNVPLILLVYLVFYGIPSVGGFAYSATTSFIITLSLYAGAYLVEVFRAGLDAIPHGLIDAGRAIGLTPWQRTAYVQAPTMLRIVLPSLSNAFISLFKDTAIASVIAVPELTYGANWIYTNTFRIIEVYSVVTPMYLVTGWSLLLLLRQLERRLALRRA
jgi:polar amino acid transport system permease protein